MSDTTLTARVEHARRLNNTVNGNPRWELYVVPEGMDYGHTLVTKSDTSDAYGLEKWVGKDAVLTLTRAGRVRWLNEVEAKPE